MSFDAHKNFAVSTVLTAPSPATSGTSLVVQSSAGTRFPTVPFNATVWPAGAVPDPSNAEIVRVTGISTDTLTITRAQEGSSARTIVVGDYIAATITAKTLTDVEETVGAGVKIFDSQLGSDTASFDITSIPSTYDHLEVMAMLRSDVSGEANSFGQLIVNNDTAGNYDHQHVWGNNSSAGAAAQQAGTSLQAFFETGPSADASHFAFARILIPWYTDTTFTKILQGEFDMIAISGTLSSWFSARWTGHWRSTAAINRLTIKPSNSANNFKTGSRCVVYGR